LFNLGNDRRRGRYERGAEIPSGSTVGRSALQIGPLAGYAGQLGELMVDNSSEYIWDCHCHEGEISW
jgi:hypothetical protein